MILLKVIYSPHLLISSWSSKNKLIHTKLKEILAVLQVSILTKGPFKSILSFIQVHFYREKIPIWPLLILYQMDHFLNNNSVALPSGTNHDCEGWIISSKKYLNQFPSNFERTLYNALQRMVGQKLRNNFNVIDLGMSTILILLR